MKIFLSSTILDLKDLRDTLVQELETDGHKIIASEKGTLPVNSGKHSYEQCLKAAAECDCLIAVIDGRFGGVYPPGSNKSITEAEIEEALKQGKKTLVFVRQSVWDALATQKAAIFSGKANEHWTVKNIIEEVKVFGLIDRIRRKPQDNWIFQFNYPTDLLVQIRDQIGTSGKAIDWLRGLESINQNPQNSTTLVGTTLMTNEELLEVIEKAARDRQVYLNLSYHALTSIPAEISQLTHLQDLYLNSNQLTNLPAEIGQLTNLQNLYLDRNQLTNLPVEIVQLTNLQNLYLDYNQLTNLPTEIGQLTNLSRVEFVGNPLPTLPAELQEKGWRDILNFYWQLEQETDRIYEAKLLIIGESGAGKTTLAKKIQSSDYQLQEEDSTKGIDVIKWQFSLDNGKEFHVNIWDFGGQEIYHTTHQFFLTKRSLYALVVDTRKEDTNFYYWLNVIELLSDNSPLLIVKNEKQERQREINERQLRGEFTNLRETLPTNLATQRGLPEILRQIKHYISNLPHVGTELPKTWVKVRQALERESRNHISLDEYLKLCEDNGFTRREDKLQLSGYLHDLGVCLHFQEDDLLIKTVILKPTWGTDAVYKVLDNKQVINNQGRFSRDDLNQIWHENKYATMQPELLRLMMNFKLCYEIPNTPKTYIAPQWLTPNQPDYTWDESENLFLRYEYEFMPKGIMTRFIVEMHAWIESQSRVWKSGVILSKDGARAEVTELYRYHKGEIRIRVSGKRRRDLLTTIRHELGKIHDSYNSSDDRLNKVQRLKYKTLVPCNCVTCKSGNDPYFYSLDIIHKFRDARKDIQCQNSFDMVDVHGLIDDIVPKSYSSLDARKPRSEGINNAIEGELENRYKN
jgi:internalin A